MKIIFFALISLSVSSVLAMTPEEHRAAASAVRAPGEEWTSKIHQDVAPVTPPVTAPSQLAVEAAVPPAQVDLSQVTRLADYKTVQDYFIKVRDARFIQDTTENMLRRITWMYPDDGCFARASLINSQLVAAGAPALSKFYAFGNLEAQSTNAAGGVVYWWYHVAAVASDGQDTYILDPALEPMRPLKLAEWIGRLGGDPSLVVAACAADTYTPYSDCYHPDPADKANELIDDISYLPQEKDRLVLLGRDWQKELGDEPPWLAHSRH